MKGVKRQVNGGKWKERELKIVVTQKKDVIFA